MTFGICNFDDLFAYEVHRAEDSIGQNVKNLMFQLLTPILCSILPERMGCRMQASAAPAHQDMLANHERIMMYTC